MVHWEIPSQVAARAHRVGRKQDFMLGGKWHPIVDWDEIDPELDPDEMAKVTFLFLCGFVCT